MFSMKQSSQSAIVKRGSSVIVKRGSEYSEYSGRSTTASFSDTSDCPDIRTVEEYGVLTEVQYNQLLLEGDICRTLWHSMSAELSSFSGMWQVMVSRSDSIDGILKALGVGMIKRAAVSSFPSTVEISVSNMTVNLCTHLPMGIKKRTSIEFNGQEVDQPDADTAVWRTTPHFINGRAIQRRECKIGLMFDTRAVFPVDPKGVVDGPMMLFRWSFKPMGSTKWMVSERWFKKLP